MKKILTLILLEVIIIFCLTLVIYSKRNNLQFTILQKNKFIWSKSGKLSYYYEPIAGTIIKDGYDQGWPFFVPYTIAINKETLNEKYDYQVDKPQNTLRIITLGDSFTFGVFVDTAKNWTEVLEDKFSNCKKKKVEVINLGVPGYDISYSVERLKKRGLKYSPDLIVFFVKYDDLLENKEFFNNEKMEKIKKQLKSTGEYQLEIKKGNYYPEWQIAYNQLRQIYSEKNIININLSNIVQIRQIYSEKLILLTVMNNNTDIAMLEAAHETNAVLYRLRNFPKKEFEFPDNHPNIEGHNTIAKELYEFLSKQKIVQCE